LLSTFFWRQKNTCTFSLDRKSTKKIKTGEKQLKLFASQLKENNSSRQLSCRDSNRFSFLTLLRFSFFTLFFTGRMQEVLLKEQVKTGFLI
jgi:hypothetical protein